MDVPIHQFQYLATQISYGMSKGASSFENNSTPYALYSSGKIKKSEKKSNKDVLTKTQVVDPLHFLIL